MITVKPILPGAKALAIFNPGAHRRAWERTRDMAVNKAKEEIKAITGGWAAPPVAVAVAPTEWGAEITVSDRRFIFNDLGTRKHVIRPKKKKFLRFTAGGSTVFARRVNHPGTKAQGYTKRVQQAVDRLNMAAQFANIVQELTR